MSKSTELFIQKKQLLWKLGLISRIVWVSHVFNLIVIIGFYISASQSLKILLKCFLEKRKTAMTVQKKNICYSSSLLFLEALLYNKQKER